MRAIVVLASVGLSAVALGAPPAPRIDTPTQSAQPAPSQVAAPAPSTVRSFSPEKVELAWANRRWQLVHQGEVLKDFGAREQEARLAHRLIRELQLDGRGTVGTPQPVMEYWLARGEAPRGQMRGGMRTVPLDPARLRVEQVKGHWYLREGNRPLFCFGASGDDARQALGVIQRYGFDQVGVIGDVAPMMYVFLRRPHDEAPALPGHATALPAGRQMGGPRFSRLAKHSDGTPKVEKKPAGPGVGLEGTLRPAMPPLAVAPVNRDWRGQPHFGHRPLQAPLTPVADRTAFDWRQAQVRQVGGEWYLLAGRLPLARFGQNFREAQLALSALRHYRFTEQQRFGEPAVNVYAAHARSPRGVLLGLPSEGFAPDQLAVGQVGNQYALVQGNRVVLSLGARKQDADKLLATVKQQRFDRVCKLGEPGKEGMTFFVRSPELTSFARPDGAGSTGSPQAGSYIAPGGPPTRPD